MKKLLLYLLLSVVVVGCNHGFSKILKSDDQDYKLQMADKFYGEKKYNKAQQLYAELFPVFKGTDKFEDLYYKYAFCAFNMRDYVNSENLFNGYLGVFPNSVRAEEVAYMHAYSFYKQSPKVELDQSNTLKTIGMMQTFINNHPNSAKIKDAQDIIDKCRGKLEDKEYKSARLYYDLKQYQAAGIYFEFLVQDYPDSPKGDEYMFMGLKSDFEFAHSSIITKQQERYQKVVDGYFDFVDRFPESKYLKDAQSLRTESENIIKRLKNDQINTTAGR